MLTKRYPSRDGCFGVTVKPQIVRETDQLRGDIPRSRWVERALVMYNTSVKGENEGKEKEEDNQNGVKGGCSGPPNQLPTHKPTPSTQVTRTANTILEVQPATSKRSGL
jgi:hypothetical protein